METNSDSYLPIRSRSTGSMSDNAIAQSSGEGFQFAILKAHLTDPVVCCADMFGFCAQLVGYFSRKSCGRHRCLHPHITLGMAHSRLASAPSQLGFLVEDLDNKSVRKSTHVASLSRPHSTTNSQRYTAAQHTQVI